MQDIHNFGAIRKALSEVPAIGSDRYKCIYAIAASTFDLGYYHSIGQASRTFEMSKWHANVWSNVNIGAPAEAHVKDLAKLWDILNSLGETIKKCDSYCKCPLAEELDSLSRQAEKRFEIMQNEQKTTTGVFRTVKTVGSWLGGFFLPRTPQAFPLDSFLGRRAGQINIVSGIDTARKGAGQNTTASLRKSPSAVRGSQSRRAASPSPLLALPSRPSKESGNHVIQSGHRRDPRPVQVSTVPSHAQQAPHAASQHRCASEALSPGMNANHKSHKRAISPTPGLARTPSPSSRSAPRTPPSTRPVQARPAGSAARSVHKLAGLTAVPPTKVAPPASRSVLSQSNAPARTGTPSNNPYGMELRIRCTPK